MSFSRCRFLLCFVFFQAEDGIRDATVTGVQTCALPIYGLRYLGSKIFFTALLAHTCWNRSEERRVGKSVDLGGRRIIKKKKKETKEETPSHLAGCRLLHETPETNAQT